MKSYRLLIIGAGRMAEAILSGLKKQEPSLFSSITVANKSDERRLTALNDKYQVETTNNWMDDISNYDVIVLAAPPKAHDSLLQQLSAYINGQLIVTVAAGIDPSYMEQKLPVGTPVCWMMPNTAALVQKSMTTYVCGTYVEDVHRKMITHILRSIGDYEELSEEQVHDLTAITGSAPAFLYLMSEALEKAAVSYGINNEQAQRLVSKMIAGCSAMLETGESAEELRDQVTSPGGSTAAGIKVLQEYDFESTIKNAVKATNQHARSQK